MQEQEYRCIHAACARPLPHRVNFCPYCGTGQHAGVDKPAHAIGAGQPGQHPQTAQAMAPAPPPVTAAAPAPAAERGPAAGAAQAWGRQAGAGASATPGKARRTERRPVRLRWWLLGLVVVLAAWIADKPRKIEARIDRAIALGEDCKLRDAQSELIALRDTRATAEQLRRLQQAINQASVRCERDEKRAKAWRDTVAAVNGALDRASFARAQQRLSAYARKWGEDSDTRRLKQQIASARTTHRQADTRRSDKEMRNCLAQGREWIEGSCW